jgi:hypothetical protein
MRIGPSPIWGWQDKTVNGCKLQSRYVSADTGTFHSIPTGNLNVEIHGISSIAVNAEAASIAITCESNGVSLEMRLEIVVIGRLLVDEPENGLVHLACVSWRTIDREMVGES